MSWDATRVEGMVARFPRVALGHWPTPLEPCRRLQQEFGGPLIWIKRDDCSGLAFGGNKTRKLEFLLGEAQAQNASRVVSFGALQSNHARQTAAACARVGLPCDLILTEAVDRHTDAYHYSGNRVLDGLLGADVHVVAGDVEALRMAAVLAEDDPERYFIDPGGSNPTGTLGYVAAAGELAHQLRAAQIEPARVVLAASTGGTAAGLALGLAAAEMRVSIEAVAVYAGAAHTGATIDRLIAATAERLEPTELEAMPVSVDDAALGDGYGIETEASHAAVLTLAHTEGVLLDPVYTAKAFAHLLGSLSDTDPGGDVVFLHTGGQPGLFAYADAFI